MPFWRDPKPRSNMRADEIQAAAVARAGKKIEAGFEPVVEAVGDLDRLVPRVIGRNRTVVSLFRSPRCKVIVQFNHRNTARNGLRSVNLDFIVVLRASDRREENDEGQGEQ